MANYFQNFLKNTDPVEILKPTASIKPEAVDVLYSALEEDEEIQRRKRIDELNTIDLSLREQISKDEEQEDDFGFWDGVGDFFKGIPEGAKEGVNNMADFFQETLSSVFDTDIEIPSSYLLSVDRFETDVPESIPGAIGGGLGQLAVGLVPGGAAVKVARAPKAIEAILKLGGMAAPKAARLAGILSVEAGALIGEQLVFDPNDPIISNLVQQFPEAANPITEFLATDPTDPEALNRFKMAVEGAGVATVLTPVLSYVGNKIAKYSASKAVETNQIEKELVGLGEADRGKQYLFEEYLLSRGMTNQEAIVKTRSLLEEGTIDDIIRDSTGRNPEDVLAEMKQDPEVLERVLARQVLDGNGQMDPVLASHNVRKWQREGTLDDVVAKVSGRTAKDWMSSAMETVVETADTLPVRTPKDSEGISEKIGATNKGFRRILAEYIRPNLLIDDWQRKAIGFGAEPAEVAKVLSGETVARNVPEGLDPAVTPAILFDQNMNKSMAMAQGFLEEGFDHVPIAMARLDSVHAQPDIIPTKSLGNIFKEQDFTLDEAREFLDWVQAERSEILKSRGISNVLQFKETTPEVISKGRANVKFDKAIGEYRILMQGVLENARRSGLLSKEDVSNIVSASKNSKGEYFYAPFFIDPNGLEFKAAVGKGNGFKAIKGNLDVELMNPLEAISQYVYTTMFKSNANMAKRSFYDTVDRMATRGDEGSKLLASQTAKKLNPQELASNKSLRTQLKGALATKLKELSESGDSSVVSSELLELSTKNLEDMSLEELLKFAPANHSIEAKGKFYDVVFRDGKPTLYEVVDPDIARFMKWMGPANMKSATQSSNSFVSKTIDFFAEQSKKGTKLYGAFVTKAPNFAVVNSLRDTISASINSPFAFIPLWSSAKGLVQGIKNKEMYREMILSGVLGGTRSETIPRRIKDLGKLAPGEGHKKFSRQLQTNLVKRVYNQGMQGWSDIVTRLETASRVAEYNLAKQHGASPDLAAFFANEVSTNFMKRGANQNFNTFADHTVFLNASLQSGYKFFRTLANQPGKAAALISGWAMYDLATDELARLHPEYSQIDEETKALHTIIPLPKDMNKALEDWMQGKPTELDDELPFVLVPIPYDVGSLGKLMTNAVRDVVSDDAKEDTLAALKRWATNSIPSVGMPTMLAPVWEQAIKNENFFGEPIVPEYYQSNVNMERMYRANTNNLAIFISDMSKKLDGMFRDSEGAAFIHPLVADHYINSYTPGMLGMIKSAADVALRPDEYGERPSKTAGGQPKSLNPIVYALEDVKKRFALDYSELREGARVLYELQQTAKDIQKSTDNLARREGLIKERILERIVEDSTGVPRKVKDIYPFVGQVSQVVRLINDNQANISRSKDLTGDQKRDEIAKLEKQKKQILIRFLISLDKMDPERDLKRITKQGGSSPMILGDTNE